MAHRLHLRGGVVAALHVGIFLGGFGAVPGGLGAAAVARVVLGEGGAGHVLGFLEGFGVGVGSGAAAVVGSAAAGRRGAGTARVGAAGADRAGPGGR